MSLPDRSVSRPGTRRRSAVSVTADELVSVQPLRAEGSAPVWFKPSLDGVNLLTWVLSNVELVTEQLHQHAAVLFRGFAEHGIQEFQGVVQALGGGDLLEYSYASTPRSRVAGNVYTSTEYPASQEIPQHNEMSYARDWPMKLGFYSITAATAGGETPLADSRRVYDRIPAEIRDEFEAKQVMYVRNYGQGLDLPWQAVFQTQDRSEVEDFCRDNGIEWQWKPGDGLRTRQVCQAVQRHPVTGELVWFNQAHLFHVSSLDPDLRDTLLRTLGESELPRNAFFGDGTPIESAALDLIRRAYQDETFTFPWQDGDVTVLENMLVSHGRRPFEGPRRLVVAMAQPQAATGLEA